MLAAMSGSDETISLEQLLPPNHILSPLDAHDCEEAIAALLQRLHRADDGFDLAAVQQAILQREHAGGTLVAPGLALPHARLATLDRPRLAIGVSRGGIPCGSDHPPVHVIVLVLTPLADPGLYLRIVAALMQRMQAVEVARCVAACESPATIHALFTEGGAPLPPYLSAAHVMHRKPTILTEGDTLADALHAFCTHDVRDIPVVDAVGDVCGVVAIEDFLRLSLPEHLLWMEDLSPILHFQPFADVLRKDRETRVADFLREEYIAVAPSLPAIQVARLFLIHKVRQILVVEGRRFLGVIDMDHFVTQLFWA